MTDKSETWQAWLADQDRWNGDYWYRGVYAAYLAAERVGGAQIGGEARLWAAEGGGYLLSTNDSRDPLKFADAA